MSLFSSIPSLIRSEIQTDPLGLGYARKTPQQMADLLNARSYILSGSIPNARLRRWAAAGPRARLEAAKGSTNAVIASLALTALDVLADGNAVLDLADLQINNPGNPPGTIQVMNTVGVLSDSDVSSLLALGQQPASRLEILYGQVGLVATAADVTAALGS